MPQPQELLRPVAPFQIREERNFNGVGENSSPTIQLDMSRTINKIYISYSGIDLDQISNIFLKVEGTTTHELGTGPELQLRNDYLGKGGPGSSENMLEIDFSSAGSVGGPGGANLDLSSILGAGLGGPVSLGGIVVSPRNVEIEMRLGSASVPGNAIALKCWTVSTPPSQLGGFQQMRRYQESLSGNGRIDFDDIPMSMGLLNRIYLHDPNDSITHVGMRINSIEVIQDIPVEVLDEILLSEPMGTRKKTPGLKVLDTSLLGMSQYGYITDALRTTDIRVRVDVIPTDPSATTTITMYLELWDVIRRGGA